MKQFIIILILIITLPANSQDFKVQLRIDVCECFTGITDFELDSFESCFVTKLADYQSDLEKLIDKNSKVSEYEQGVIIGEKLIFEIQQDLIENCDSYYFFFSDLREQSLISLKDEFKTSTIDSLSIKISNNRSLDLLWKRGNAYFANNDLSNAEKDYRECLELDPNHIQSIFFLGWLYERNKNYSKAIEMYKSVLEMTGKQELVIFIELARRKSKE